MSLASTNDNGTRLRLLILPGKKHTGCRFGEVVCVTVRTTQMGQVKLLFFSKCSLVILV